MWYGRLAVLSLATVGLFGAISPEARAANPVRALCSVGRVCVALDAAQLFELADRLSQVGRAGDAEVTLRGLASDHDPEIRAEARFRLGSLQQARGDLAGAASAYRALLDEKPGATPVRLALAQVLAGMGDEGAASSQLRRAASAGLPEDVARVIDTFQLALRSRRRIGGSIAFSLAPDSNINRATSNETVTIGSTPFTLSRDARARSGVGANVGTQVFWRPALDPNTNLLLSTSMNADLYSQSAFDSVILSLAGGPELLRGRTRYRTSLVVSRRWFGRSRYSDSYGVTANWMRQLDRVSQVQLDLTALHTNYQVNNAMDGLTVSAVARYERALSPRLFGRITARVDRQEAREPAFSSWSAATEWLITREIGRHSVFASVGYGRTRGDAPFALPPVRRQDRSIDLEVGVLLRGFAFRGFAPLVQAHRTVNRSPVFLYDFRRTKIEFGLSREF